MSPAENLTLAAALGYAQAAIPVFPLRPRDKRPAIEGWPERATTDEATIRGWWANGADSGIGILTGAASGIVIIDIDPRNGGDVSLAELEREHGKLPETITCLTGGGGKHYYFALPPGVEIRCRPAFRKGIDIKGSGGYVVAPPSVHPNGTYYRWKPGHNPGSVGLAELPDWIVHECADKRAGPSAMPADLFRDDGGPPADIGPIREGCGFLAWVHNCPPEVDEPSWYAALSILVRCKSDFLDGAGLCHQWSRGSAEDRPPAYSGYSVEETERKLRRAKQGAGPRTCQNIENITNGRFCASCGHRGQITSPIVLGRQAAKAASGTRAGVPDSGPRAILVRASEVVVETARFLWDPYVPDGKLTNVEGDPKVGKTFLCLALCSAASRGDPLPCVGGGKLIFGKKAGPVAVIYASAEDGLGDTLRPRLESMGADLGQIYFLTGKKSGDGIEDAITFDDMALIAKAVEKTQAKLIVVDPIQAYMPPGVDSHKIHEVRPVLARLAHLAADYNCAILAVRHLRKSAAESSLYRGQGSIDFVAAARSVIGVAKVPGKPNLRVMAHVASTLRAPGPSITFDLSEGTFKWGGPSDISAETIYTSPPRERQELESAKTFLRGALVSGAQSQRSLEAGASERGISVRTLRRAKKELGIKTEKRGRPGESGEWRWRLDGSGDGGVAQGGAREPGRDDLDDGSPTLSELHGHLRGENGCKSLFDKASLEDGQDARLRWPSSAEIEVPEGGQRSLEKPEDGHVGHLRTGPELTRVYDDRTPEGGHEFMESGGGPSHEEGSEVSSEPVEVVFEEYDP
ncbi:MAG: bifunctional DNA primase/polymerase [Planctomycetota bacterium]